MSQNITDKLIVLTVTAALSSSCYFSVKPVYNSNTAAQSAPTPQIKTITDRDDLKAKALISVNLLHEQMKQRKFEEAYQMIDDKSPLKNPKHEALENLKEIIDMLGKLKNKELVRDNVLEVNGQLQVRQEFIVDYEKDIPTPKRYELFTWNIHPDNGIKLFEYISSKGDD